MDQIVNLDAFPLNDPDSERGQALIQRCQDDLDTDGLFNLEGFLKPEAIKRSIENARPVINTRAFEHRREHNVYFERHVEGLEDDHPALRTFETVNHTICADQIPENDLVTLYDWEPFRDFLAAVMKKPKLYTMPDRIACMNVMTYRQGEALNWHFDRSEFTTTLLLQSPERGGHFEYRNDLRTDHDPNYDGVARLIDGEDRHIRQLKLSAGTLNVFRGKNTLHRVTPVAGAQPRVIAVFSYYERPDVYFSNEERLGFYGRLV